MHRKFLYVINPVSGTRSKGSLQEIIEARTREAGFEYLLFPSIADGNYSFLNTMIPEHRITDIIIAGGDGTVNGVVGSVKSVDVQFGIIPCGSGNGLALTAGLPKDWNKALAVIFKGKSKGTDAFTVNEKFGSMLCGLGFDAQVAHAFANDPNRGLKTYIKQSVKNFFAATTYPFELIAGQKKVNVEAFFISVANSNQFGNNVTIAPKASLSDGLLDIVIVTKQNKLSVLVQTAVQVSGFNRLQKIDGMDKKASVIYFQTGKLTIINTQLAPMHIDGEPVEPEPTITITVLPNYFKLIVP